MPFPPERNHRISLAEAETLTKRYRESISAGSMRGGMFPRKVFEEVLAQPGCAGIRIYFGKAEDGKLELVLVGVNGDGNDMYKGTLMDVNYPCPPVCGNDGSTLHG